MTAVRQHSQQYIDYLQSPQWRVRRAHAIFKAHGSCMHCRRGGRPLEVHHLTYDRLGHEDPSDLVALCHECHEKADAQRRRATEDRQWYARLDGWASKKYGEDWESYVGFDVAEEEFSEWLEWQ